MSAEWEKIICLPKVRSNRKENTMITRDEAFELLKKYNKDPFHIQHALTVEAVMKWYAKELGYEDDKDYWAQISKNSLRAVHPRLADAAARQKVSPPSPPLIHHA